jgi:hypothetical protein
MTDFDEPGTLAPTGLFLGGRKYMVSQPSLLIFLSAMQRQRRWRGRRRGKTPPTPHPTATPPPTGLPLAIPTLICSTIQLPLDRTVCSLAALMNRVL